MEDGVRLSRFALFYGVLFAVGAVWAYAQGLNLVVQRPTSALGVLAHLGLGAVTGLAVVGLSRALAFRFEWARRLESALAEALGPFSRAEALLVAALSAIGEEALFRGAMQPAVGLPLTAIAFGLLHVGPGRVFLPWTAMAIAAGFLFGGLQLATGDLLTPVVAHCVINFINLRHLSRRVAPEEETSLPWS